MNKKVVLDTWRLRRGNVLKTWVDAVKGYFFPIVVFFVITLFLTFRSVLLGDIVIGDNFYWSSSTVDDLLGAQVIHESYLGDISILSTFKNGFLFPLATILNSVNAPLTLIYPFLFIFLSMFSFYLLSSEFLEKQYIAIVVSILYVVNPVVPFYFMSLLLAFAVVFLPLAFKYFIRTLRDVESGSLSWISSKVLLCAAFLALSISAHGQLLPSVAIISVFFLVTFLFSVFFKYGFNKRVIWFGCSNISLFLVVLLLVNLPLVLSLGTSFNSSLSTYYTGRLDDFTGNVLSTYKTASVDTLLRFGGDSGLGLGQNAWFDSGSFLNIFGYVIFALVFVSLIFLLRSKGFAKSDKIFFIMSSLLFLVSFSLILFIKYLPSNTGLLEILFSLPLQSWESPTKLRLIMFLSALVLTFLAFQKLQIFSLFSKRNKLLAWIIVCIVVSSTVAYNSSWVINSFGNLGFEQVSDNLNWGSLSDEKYTRIVNFLEENFTTDRGIIIPYTHKAELYSPPNFRVLQLVSEVNSQLFHLSQGSSVPWSKVVGLLSAKYVVINNGDYNPYELALFPKVYDQNLTRVKQEMGTERGLDLLCKEDNFSVYANSNSLPKLYASNYYVIYDQVSSLPYAMRLVNFSDLPVFISSESALNEFVFPRSLCPADYNVYAASIENTNEESNLLLQKVSRDEVELIALKKNTDVKGLNLYSTQGNFLPGDSISFSSSSWINSQKLDSLVLNSTSHLLGTYGSFMVNFTVNVLENGGYSFLSPRVLIDLDNSTRYFVIFHDNGVIELSLMQDNIFYSGVISKIADYALKSSSDSIDVMVRREFDIVEVFVNGELSLSFPINTVKASVFLSSESSISNFTDVRVQTNNVVRLFATKSTINHLDFVVIKDSPIQSVLRVFNGSSDYAVVNQYLNTPLRNIKTPLINSAIIANIFFNGWIVQPADQTKEVDFEISFQNSEFTLVLTSFSILFTYSVIIFSVFPVSRQKCFQKILRFFSEMFQGVKS